MKFRWTIVLAAAILALSSCGKDLKPFDTHGPSKAAERNGVSGLHFDKLMILYSEGYNNLRDYLDQNFKPQHGKYTDFTAQIIQHEIDHFEGTLI